MQRAARAHLANHAGPVMLGRIQYQVNE